jgi:hypothetical protein
MLCSGTSAAAVLQRAPSTGLHVQPGPPSLSNNLTWLGGRAAAPLPGAEAGLARRALSQQMQERMGGLASAAVLRPVQAAIRAAARGDASPLRHLLHAAPQLIYAVNNRGKNAAHLAAQAGAVAAVEELLLAAPALFRVMDRRGRLPAHLTDASRNGLVRAPRVGE